MQKDKQRPRIDCYLIGDCASEPLLRALMNEVKRHAPAVEVKIHRVSPEDAQVLGIKGSPTVMVNGQDISPQTSFSAGT